MSQAKRSKEEYRIALVGCGRISKNHFDAIAQVEGLRLTAVGDSDADRARAAGEERGVPWFDDYAQMLRSAECDIVAICSPSGLHSAHGVAAAKAGKHVVTEKPMAITLEQADALVSATDAAGVKLFVVKQNRLNPSIQLLKRAVDKGRFGRIYLANTTVRRSEEHTSELQSQSNLVCRLLLEKK